MPFAGARAPRGSVSTGWAIPRFSSSSASVPISTTASSGIAVFLAAHAAVTGSAASGELALAGVSHLRKNLKSRNAARMARSARRRRRHRTGLDRLCADRDVEVPRMTRTCLRTRRRRRNLFTDELIAADKQLDVIGGSAGAILGLLRLYRDTQIRRRAAARDANAASTCWRKAGSDRRAAAAGSGKVSARKRSTACRTALQALPMRLRRCRRRRAAKILRRRRRNALHLKIPATTPARHNWPDLRGGGEPSWPCQWCHGAPGIGLARIAMGRQAARATAKLVAPDIGNAVEGVEARLAGQRSTRCAAARSAASNFSARRPTRLAASDFVSLRRDGWRRFWKARQQPAITAGTAASGNSIWVCSAALPASATRCCGRSTIHCPTS